MCWLLAAGGAGHGKSEVVAGPTVLMLQHDGASSIHDTFHLTGKGKSWKHFNNTGVLYNFAVTNGAPKPPAGMWPVKESANWSLYAGPSDVIVITHKGKGIGLLAVFDRNNCSSSLLDELIKVNGGELSSKDRIEVPHGVKCMAQRKGVRSFSYDVTQGHGAWVITEVNDQPTNTDFSTWPLIDIEGRWFPQQPEPHHLKALWADNQ
ncbi:hypothetical protein PTSG_10450 [Salpingoeca rosetta]|uniref:Uncharacterized protein n=1 Tax=Salpingoeca rosetta (strain ATCC 50818 / BSB-021) TaxID=946362 RepID=F2UPP7_SALR5|nr:uncharacterized protein PTSG_10450 [Salpingoeca rosetta]EGD79602.1 hypothetical protein PTSG_10450 [Salpingoeca rosetta]|eukprot:XP_004988830.1 hypothetical protein PTSG_10450 [Salpingoeca rosetta]